MATLKTQPWKRLEGAEWPHREAPMLKGAVVITIVYSWTPKYLCKWYTGAEAPQMWEERELTTLHEAIDYANHYRQAAVDAMAKVKGENFLFA